MKSWDFYHWLREGNNPSIDLINMGDISIEKSIVSKKIVEAMNRSPSLRRILQSNQQFVEITPSELHQLIVDFIIEQWDNKDIPKMSEWRYLSIDYIARFMLRLMMRTPHFNYMSKQTFTDFMSKWEYIWAWDAATFHYLIAFRRRKVLISRQEFLEMAYTAYSRVFTEIPKMPEALMEVIHQVTPLAEMILVSPTEASLETLKNKSIWKVNKTMISISKTQLM